MISNTLLKIVSGILLVIIVGVVASEVAFRNPAFITAGESKFEEGSLLSDTAIYSVDKSDELGNENVEPLPADKTTTKKIAGGRLTVGVMGATPRQSEIVTIEEIPWLKSQINRAFRDAEDAASTLLAPGTPLNPSLATSREKGPHSLGRIPAFTVGLEIDESAKKKLPVTTKGAIQNYLREHRLAIEPTVYESEDGSLYFGTDCRAAFYKQSSPYSTVKAEPMIDEAIGRFRALGVLGGTLAQDGRTLLMAFRYVKSSERLTSVSGGLDTETELLILHLDADATPAKLAFSAFVTSEERQKLHELEIGGAVLRQAVPTITATIRFDSFVMMGMYPAEPVVTGVRHQVKNSLPVQTVRQLTDNNTTTGHLSFENVLDQFGALCRQTADIPKSQID